MNEDGVNTDSAMDNAIKGWNEVNGQAHPLRLEEASLRRALTRWCP